MQNDSCPMLDLPNKRFKLFKGEMKGKFNFHLRKKGFGYDPIFIPSTQPYNNKLLTYGEIEPKFKNLNSHRNIAFNKLLSFITNENKVPISYISLRFALQNALTVISTLISKKILTIKNGGMV